MRNLYMHLMDGQPAYFDKKDQLIYFMPVHNHRLKQSDVLCGSLEELRRQQAESEQTLADRGRTITRTRDMDYLRIPVESPELLTKAGGET